MTTPNMVLTLPVVSDTLGPQWATQLNAALEVVDAHDHSSGKGVKITPAGMNITTNLTFNSNGATSLGYIGFGQRSTPTDNDVVFVDTNGSLKWKTSNGEFTILDTNGSSASSGGFGGDYTSTDAIALYSDTTKAYSFLQDTGITAFINSGAISLYENVASSNPITLQPPTSLASAYSLTLPAALPGANNRAIIASTTGVLSFNNQSLQTTDAVTFATVNTGQGANELYAMNQDVQTTDDVTFSAVELVADAADDIILTLKSLGNTDTIRQYFYNADETRNFNLSAFFGSGTEVLNLQADNRTFMKFNRDGEIEVSTANTLTGLLLNGTVASPAVTTNAGSSVTAFTQKYMRVGSTVTMSGAIQVTTDGSGEVDLEVALPVASNFGTSEDLDGAVSLRLVSSPGTPILMNSAIFADASSNRMAVLVHTATGSTAIQIRYVATYEII